MSKSKQIKKRTIYVLTMSAILFTFTVCGVSGKEILQKPATGTVGLSDTESVQIETTDRQEGELMQEYDFSIFSNVELIGVDLSAMSGEQMEILYRQAMYCQAMTDADIDTMRELVSENMVFTHMSGRQQTREEYFADVENGNLRYFTIGIDSPVVEVDGDFASVTYTSVLNANAYGARGTYRMDGTHWFEKREDGWFLINAPEH